MLTVQLGVPAAAAFARLRAYAYSEQQPQGRGDRGPRCTNHPHCKQDGYQIQGSSKFWPGRPEEVRCAAVRKSVLAIGATVTAGQERACAVTTLSRGLCEVAAGMPVSAE